MGLGLPIWKYKSVDAFPFARKIEPAVSDPLVWLVPGLSDIDLARRNFADGDLLSVAGTPVVGAHYITGNGNVNFLKTAELEPAEFTVCLIAKRDDTAAANATIGTLFGSYAGATVPGCLCYWSSSTNLRFQAYQATDTQKVANLTPTSPTTLKRYTFIVTAAAVTAINETESVTVTTAITAARQPGTLPINVLSSNSLSFLGAQGVYSFAMWDKALSAPERSAHWAQMALQLARDGVSVS